MIRCFYHKAETILVISYTLSSSYSCNILPTHQASLVLPTSVSDRLCHWGKITQTSGTHVANNVGLRPSTSFSLRASGLRVQAGGWDRYTCDSRCKSRWARPVYICQPVVATDLCVPAGVQPVWVNGLPMPTSGCDGRRLYVAYHQTRWCAFRFKLLNQWPIFTKQKVWTWRRGEPPRRLAITTQQTREILRKELHLIHSFGSLSYDRPITPCKTISPTEHDLVLPLPISSILSCP